MFFAYRTFEGNVSVCEKLKESSIITLHTWEIPIVHACTDEYKKN